ncbi:hypothetical protein DTO207G8_7827 [Paecilomyces variotii]|nr:hypothetical protein DTO207G8_7827 [Paecilomyces variotii]
MRSRFPVGLLFEVEVSKSFNMNRSLSVRTRNQSERGPGRHRFSMATLRGMQQPELSKKLYKIIKNENVVIGGYESAGRERVAIAAQLSDWGETTGDDAVSDISDKLGVLLAEIGEQEDYFAQNLEDYRSILKQIRNTESSVQPSRDNRAKIQDEIQKLKYRDPTNTKLVSLEQELVRAEAQNLVAEAQLTNVTRQKLKEAYDLHLAATIERAEKQIILARQGRRLLNLLDDTPVVPGDPRQPYERGNEARQILEDADNELRAWEPHVEPVERGGELAPNLMPGSANQQGEQAEDTILGTPAPVADVDGAAERVAHQREETQSTTASTTTERPSGSRLEPTV